MRPAVVRSRLWSPGCLGRYGNRCRRCAWAGRNQRASEVKPRIACITAKVTISASDNYGAMPTTGRQGAYRGESFSRSSVLTYSAVAGESSSVFTHRRWTPSPYARRRPLGINHLEADEGAGLARPATDDNAARRCPDAAQPDSGTARQALCLRQPRDGDARRAEVAGQHHGQGAHGLHLRPYVVAADHQHARLPRGVQDRDAAYPRPAKEPTEGEKRNPHSLTGGDAADQVLGGPDLVGSAAREQAAPGRYEVAVLDDRPWSGVGEP